MTAEDTTVLTNTQGLESKLDNPTQLCEAQTHLGLCPTPGTKKDVNKNVYRQETNMRKRLRKRFLQRTRAT
jgi:hypothetical protein